MSYFLSPSCSSLRLSVCKKQVPDLDKSKQVSHHYKKKVGLTLPNGYRPTVYSSLLSQKRTKVKQLPSNTLSTHTDYRGKGGKTARKSCFYESYNLKTKMSTMTSKSANQSTLEEDFERCFSHLKVVAAFMMIPCAFILIYCQRKFNHESSISDSNLGALSRFGPSAEGFSFAFGDGKDILDEGPSDISNRPPWLKSFGEYNFGIDDDEFYDDDDDDDDNDNDETDENNKVAEKLKTINHAEPAQLFGQVKDNNRKKVSATSWTSDQITMNNTLHVMKKNGYKIVLFWDNQSISLPLGIGSFKQNRCNQSKCMIIRERLLQDTSDAVIINGQIVKTGLPEKRKQNQLWILSLFEPLDNSSLNDIIKLGSIFNKTWTFVNGSDIVHRTVQFRPISTKYYKLKSTVNALVNIWRRRKFAVYIQTQCSLNDVIKSHLNYLKKFIDVDVHKTCGTNSCNLEDDECFRSVVNDYLFLLTLEPISCSDHVDRTFLKALRHNVIPIVISPSELPKYIPLSSFIKRDQFNSISDLANYLKYVSSNLHEYQKLHNWRKQFIFESFRSDICDLCSLLHHQQHYSQHNQTSLSNYDITSLLTTKINCNSLTLNQN